MTAEPLLDVRDLKVSFRTEDGLVKAVDGVSLTLSAGETLGIVGESGSGKSVTMMSVMRLINDPNARFEGEVLYKGHDLMTLNPDQMRAIRNTGIAMIFQDPMTSLNPVYRVGWQITEQIRAHESISSQAARLDRPKPERLATIPGLPPSLLNLASGCAFRVRCTHRFERCLETPPLLDRLGNGHLDACHLEPQAKKDARAGATPPELVEDAP